MTVRELSESIGKRVYFVAGTLKFTCIVEDARISFGKPQFLIRPLKGAGIGDRWVEFASIEKINEEMTREPLTSTPSRVMIGSR